MMFKTFSHPDKQLNVLQEKWTQQDFFPASDLRYFIQPTLAFRAVVLKEILPRSPENKAALVETLLETCHKVHQHAEMIRLLSDV